MRLSDTAERCPLSPLGYRGVVLFSLGLWHKGVPDPSPSVWGWGRSLLILERIIEKQRFYDGAIHHRGFVGCFRKTRTAHKLRRKAASWGRSWIATCVELPGIWDLLRVTRKTRARLPSLPPVGLSSRPTFKVFLVPRGFGMSLR